MTSYDVGDRVEVAGTFTDENGAAINPDTVSIQYQFAGEDAVEKVFGVDPEVTNPQTGLFAMEIDTTGFSGKRCRYRIFSTGTGQAAAEGSFFVKNSPFE